MEYDEKLEALRAAMSADTEDFCRRSGYSYPDVERNWEVRVVPGKKYDKVDRHQSGVLMVERETGRIYGIKGYGVVHKGHQYGTLDTIEQWYWGTYKPTKRS